MAHYDYSEWEDSRARRPFGRELRFNFAWIKWIILAIAVLWLMSGVYIIAPDEQGVVRQFGKAVRVTEPGPHWHWPVPVETVDKVKVKKVWRIEIGFRTMSPGPPARYKFIPQESLMLTGDEQIVDAQITVQYQISDPIKYLFNVRGLAVESGALMDAAEVALRQVVGQRPIDDVLIEQKLEIEVDIRDALQSIVDRYDSGVKIVVVKLQTVRPPKELEQAFNDVVSAKEDQDRLKKEAEGYANDILPKANGEAAKLVREAEGYKEQRIKYAQGDAERFLAVLAEYQNAKDVTRKRLYLETMEKVLPGIRKFVIDPQAGSNLLQFLPLEKGGEK